MKFKSLFLPIISLATVSSLVDIHPALARHGQRHACPGPSCAQYTSPRGAVYGGGWIPAVERQQLNILINQGNFAEAERQLLPLLEEAERTQDLNGQAEVQQLLQQIELQQIELQQIELQQMQLQQMQLQQMQLQ